MFYLNAEPLSPCGFYSSQSKPPLLKSQTSFVVVLWGRHQYYCFAFELFRINPAASSRKKNKYPTVIPTYCRKASLRISRRIKVYRVFAVPSANRSKMARTYAGILLTLLWDFKLYRHYLSSSPLPLLQKALPKRYPFLLSTRWNKVPKQINMEWTSMGHWCIHMDCNYLASAAITSQHLLTLALTSLMCTESCFFLGGGGELVGAIIFAARFLL